MSKRRLQLCLRAGISIALLAYLFSAVGWRGVWQQIRELDIWYLVAYIGLGPAGTFVSALKWRVLSEPLGSRTTLGRLFPLYLVGSFFNQFLPTSVGGDVVRGYELGRIDGRFSAAVASVFMERFTGITVLVVLALLAVAWDPRFLSHPVVALAMGVTVAGYLVGTWMAFSLGLTRLAERYCRIAIAAKFIKKVRNVQETLHRYRRYRGALAWSMVLSVLFYVVAVLNTYVGCLAFGVQVPIGSLLTAVPVMMVIFLLPFSLGGIGLQEWAYTVVLAMIGVPSTVGLSLGLVFRARTMALGVLGSAAYALLFGDTVFGHRRTPADAPTAPP